jgi:hypothetical protein
MRHKVNISPDQRYSKEKAEAACSSHDLFVLFLFLSGLFYSQNAQPSLPSSLLPSPSLLSPSLIASTNFELQIQQIQILKVKSPDSVLFPSSALIPSSPSPNMFLKLHHIIQVRNSAALSTSWPSLASSSLVFSAMREDQGKEEEEIFLSNLWRGSSFLHSLMKLSPYPSGRSVIGGLGLSLDSLSLPASPRQLNQPLQIIIKETHSTVSALPSFIQQKKMILFLWIRPPLPRPTFPLSNRQPSPRSTEVSDGPLTQHNDSSETWTDSPRDSTLESSSQSAPDTGSGSSNSIQSTDAALSSPSSSFHLDEESTLSF